MQKILIDLAVPGTVDRLFTYSVPANLAHLVRPGVRALAPFGRKNVAGIIVGTPGSTTVSGLRDILDVIDEEPVVGDELMKLASWIASYYIAPIGEVLRTMLVAGSAGVGKTTVLAGAVITEDILKSHSAAPVQQQILRHLRKTGKAALSTLRKLVAPAAVHSPLNELRRKGLVRLREDSPFSMGGAKTEKVVTIDETGRRLWAGWLDVNGSTGRLSKQAAAIRVLRGMAPGAITVESLRRDHGVSAAALRSLALRGVVTIGTREVRRDGSSHGEHNEEHRDITLNPHQREALERILSSVNAGTFGAYLLWGVTGSGKTQVYIEAIARTLELGRTALVLVPEISLTPQTVGRFRRHFGDRVVMFHSRMSRGERFDAWRLARDGRYSIVIGPRSAVFAPLPGLGLIAVDEEHEPTYKQFDQSPRYNARDAAIVRATLAGAAVVLGSATPSVESFSNALSGKYTLLELPERADGAKLPVIRIVDVHSERNAKFELYRSARREQFKTDPDRAKLSRTKFDPGSISDLLRERITDRLARKEGVLLLQNRRGFSAYMECAGCAGIEMCPHCQISLTYHRAHNHLRCHYCGFAEVLPLFCRDCGSAEFYYRGLGTQKVEEELRAAFPSAAVERMDMDTTTRKGSHADILNRFSAGGIDILVGTQMIAKGLDIPRVTLVGVISADTQLLLPDFRAAERTFQLLTQVAGRSGRRRVPGEVVIQTSKPEHPIIRDVAMHDYRKFFEDELRYRKELSYPPFTRITLLEFSGENEDGVGRTARAC
ncbi:MAG TPA: primosomal protein N', partial [Bacteroidota bacterium]|nr:primosomal protein N' [Bacteroidota bacterium]